MENFDAVFLTRLMLIVYLLAAVFPLILYKKHKASNIVSNLLCMAASIVGGGLSALSVVGGDQKTEILNIPSSIPYFCINIQLDKLSAYFILGLSLLTFCVSFYSIGYMSHYYGKRNVPLFNFLYVGFVITMLLVFTAANTVFFFIVWECMALLSYFLVVFESDKKENQKAGMLYIIMTHIGSSFLLIAFMIMFSYTGTFEIFSQSVAIPVYVKNIVFVLFIIGFGTKAGIIPFHIWLPYAHPAALSNVSALMSGIMIKTAVYGIIRFVFNYMGIQCTWWGITILVIGIVSSFFGVIYALMENNIKILLAYCSIENIGIIFIGLGVSMIAYSKGNYIIFSLALLAALFHTINHAITKSGLFLAAGAVQYATHTKDMEELGGLIKSMPYTSIFMLCFSLSICAVVPFNGFVSEWITYQSLFLNFGFLEPGINILTILSVVILALSGAIALSTFVKMYGISFLGRPRSEHSQEAKEVPFAMKAGMAVPAILCLLLGIFPIYFIELIDKVVYETTRISIAESFRGSLSVVYYPINIGNGSISPFVVLISVALMIPIVFIVVRFVGGKTYSRKYSTWDCGFKELSPRMQYSGTGFSKPFRIIFRMIYRPSRNYRVEQGDSHYPESISYSLKTEKMFENYFYYPILFFLEKASRRMKFIIQAGSVHMYLIYIFVALLAVMLYNTLI